MLNVCNFTKLIPFFMVNLSEYSFFRTLRELMYKSFLSDITFFNYCASFLGLLGDYNVLKSV